MHLVNQTTPDSITIILQGKIPIDLVVAIIAALAKHQPNSIALDSQHPDCISHAATLIICEGTHQYTNK